MQTKPLRKGDLVEVRRAAEILATLDEQGTLGHMPFMPEMIDYCGRRLTVDKRAEKVCDTIQSTLQSRYLPDTVYLVDEGRCNGSGHAGCQAECRLFWNEAWLRRVEHGAPVTPAPADDATAVAALRERVAAYASFTGDDGTARYRCQATDMNAASSPLSNFDPRPHLRELTCGNVSLGTFVKVTARAAYMQPAHRFGVLPWPKGTSKKSPKAELLGLEVGEWVRIKSRQEIEATLTDTGANRGLHFDIEMAAFCGQVMRVRSRVTHIVDERDGKMLQFGSDCVMLDGAYCSGERSTGRWFCDRQIYPYWRECWLERVASPTGVSRGASTHSQL